LRQKQKHYYLDDPSRLLPANLNMSEDHINSYIQWITPSPGDPTYSLLKAHLLFEELLRSYLGRVLPHAKALEGSRLTFMQLLAVAKACSPHLEPDHWIWRAIGELNKLRNTLSHETKPKALAEKIEQYERLIIENTKRPPPSTSGKQKPDHSDANQGSRSGHSYTSIDMVTINLYYSTAKALGHKLERHL
jgi:hypothetical protein